MGEALPLNVAQQTVQLLTQETPAPPIQPMSVEVIDLPDMLANILRPVQINGIVTDMQESGTMTLQTSAGDFILSLSAFQGSSSTAIRAMIADLLTPFLDTNKPLTLSLQPTSDGVQAFLLVPKEDKAAPLAVPQPAATPPGPALETGKKETPFAEGKTLSVTILSEKIEENLLGPAPLKTIPTPKADASTAPQQAMPPELEILGGEEIPPASAKTETPHGEAKIMAQAKEALTSLLAAQEEKPLPQAAPVLNEGQEAKLKILRLIPPGETPPPPAEGQIRAEVAAQTPSGRLLLHSEGKSLIVHESGPLPPGTLLILERSLETDRDPAILPAPHERETAALRAILAALTQADPIAAQAFIQDKMPNPMAQLGGTLLFFLSALQGGKIEEWLGNRPLLQMERIGKKVLIEQLAQMLDDAGGTASDPRMGEWRVYPVPIHDGRGFDMLRLYVRDTYGFGGDGRETREEASVKQTHFLISMNMSRLGAMQLDGLSRPKQLDIVIRSETKLPEGLAGDIRARYVETLDALGLAGTIGFQTGRKNWVTIGESKQSEALIA